jgi:hypothetical protein
MAQFRKKLVIKLSIRHFFSIKHQVDEGIFTLKSKYSSVALQCEVENLENTWQIDLYEFMLV